MSDFSFEDCGIPGDGIVHDLVCSNCGARITYYVPIENDEFEAGDEEGVVE